MIRICIFRKVSHGTLRASPIRWEFHLLLAIQMMFHFILADETSTRKLCPERYKAFRHESWQNTNFFALCQNDRIIGNLVVKVLIWTDIDYIKAKEAIIILLK